MKLALRLLSAALLASPAGLFAQAGSEAEPRAHAERPSAPRADPGSDFSSEVDLVTVDVVVVDEAGRAVPGFEPGDFVVLEDGAPQEVIRFEAVELPPPAEAPAEPPPPAPFSSNQEPDARPRGRTFVLVFDDVHLSPAQAVRAKVAVNHFLKTGTRPGDRVNLVATGGSAWWSARMPEGREELVTILERLDGRNVPDASPDRVTDWEAMRIMAYDDPDVAYSVQRRFDAYGSVGRERIVDREYADVTRTTSAVGLIDPYVRSRAQDVYNAITARRKITMGVMSRALDALRGVQGRKAMVLVSQGFVYEPGFEDMKEVVEASLRANIPIYFIDTRGLRAMPAAMTAEFPSLFDVQDTVAVLADITREAEGAENVALDTGGFVIKNTNDLESGILRVSNESLAYYLLGYTPTNEARDGKFRKLEVRLADRERRKQYDVRARRGYYAPGDPPREERARIGDPEIARALDSPVEQPDVPLRVAAFTFDESLTGRANVAIAVDVDIRDLALREEEGRFRDELAFLLEVQHSDSGEIHMTDEKIEIAMLPETRERLLESGYVVKRDFTLAPGAYQVKAVVRDLGDGRLGSVIHDFEVPELDALRLSTPILADALEEQAEGDTGVPRPVLRVRRRFAQGDMLYVQYSVFGAERHETTLMPRVSAGYEIRREDGSTLKAKVRTRINPTSLGSLIRIDGISLLTAEPGRYELVLRVLDELSGSLIERREPFVVETAPARAASG